MLLLLAGCAWIGGQRHDENLDRWSIRVDTVEADAERCAPSLVVGATLSDQRAGETASLEVVLDGQTLSADAVVASDGSTRWTLGPFDEVSAGELTYQLTIDHTTVPWTSTFADPLQYLDADQDGYGTDATSDCNPSTPVAPVDGDCDDAQPMVHPDADELCTPAIDEDCDGDPVAGAVDEPTWYRDFDGDGLGTDLQTLTSCEQPSGYVADAGDCSDLFAAIGAARTWAPDVDQDGLGTDDPSLWQVSCDQPGIGNLFVANTDDCDDADDDLPATVYPDGDGDGFGDDSSVGSEGCPEPGLVLVQGDCDDASSGIRPGADELCTPNVDENCDGDPTADAVDAQLWYLDADDDGFGDPAVAMLACSQPPHHVQDASDCDDTSVLALPGGTEVCDGLDNDCMGGVDDTLTGFWVQDQGFHDFASALAAVPSGGTLALCEDAVWPNEDALDGRFITLVSGGHTLAGSLRVDNAQVTFDGLHLEGGAGTTGGDPTIEGGVLRTDLSTVHLVDSTLSCTATTPLNRGGALQIYRSTLTLEGTTIDGCSAARGGAIDLTESDLSTLGSPSTLRNNTATYGAGLHATESSLQIEPGSLVVEDNVANNDGGGAYLITTDGVIDGTWARNRSTLDAGGGLFVFSSNASGLTLQGTWTDNEAASAGGAMYLANAEVLLQEAEIGSNQAVSGGAIYLASTGILTTAGGLFESNQASERGGAIASEGLLTVEDTTFLTNQAGDALPQSLANSGGAVFLHAGAPITLTRATFDGNQAFRGGGVAIAPTTGGSGSLTLDDCFFEHNVAQDGGGAVWASGADLTSSAGTTTRFRSNQAIAGDGGAVLMTENEAPGPTSAAPCGMFGGSGALDFIGNHSGRNGGALAASTPSGVSNGSCVLDLFGNVSFSGNTATQHGGALELLGYDSAGTSSDASFQTATFSSNSSGGGAVRLHYGTFYCEVCTVSANTPQFVSLTSPPGLGTYDASGEVSDFICDGATPAPHGCEYTPSP